MDDGLLIALAVLLAYVALVYILKSKGILEKHNMSNWGPFIMWRTRRGRDLIDKLAKPARFWRAYAAVGKGVVIAVMVAMMALLIWEAFLVPSISADQAPSLNMLIGLPGINPIIPIWYGILGLVVAVFIHEFAHGILTRVGEMKVKALGIVLLVLPMGAFVEPDEEALVKVEKKKRTSVYAVGPATNVIFALVCAFLFTAVVTSSAQVAHEGPVVLSVVGGSPASVAGFQSGDQIVEINGVPVASDGFNDITAPEPGTPVNITFYRSGELMHATMISGVYISSVNGGEPASNAGITGGMILASLNNATIYDYAGFRTVLESITPGSTVNVSVMARDASGNYEVVPSITHLTTQSRASGNGTIAYLGVVVSYGGLGTSSPYVLLDYMAHPFAGDSSFGDFATSTLRYIALPFYGIQPLSGSLTDVLIPGGIFAGMSPDLFWIMANSLYWLFWINIMVGMTNALPAVPLDGGFLFRDWLDSLVGRIKKGTDEKQRERYVNSITWAIALFVLFLIMWQFIGPRVL